MDSSSSQPRWRGPRPAVFLSFYSPDIGDTFLSNLRCSLGMDGIHTYLDFDAVFRKAEDAISLRHKDIKVVVVVFSENYMSKRCCSNDLPQIIECSKQGGKLAILPVFYGVDPTDVGTQGKRFEEALVIHENKFGKESAKVERWREALSKTGSLPGCCLNDHRGEAEFIRSIVESVNNLLDCKPSGVQPKSFTTPSSQSQGQARSSHVYVSFLTHDVSYEFLRILNNEPDSEDVSGDISREELGEFSHSNIEAIKDSWMAIIVISKRYAYSRWCLEELATIMECENHGKLIVRLVFHEVDPQETTRMAPSCIAGIQEIDTGTMKRWMGVPPQEERKSDCLWEDDSDEAKLARSVIKFVEDALNTIPVHKSSTSLLQNPYEQEDLDDDDSRYDVFLSFRGADCRSTIVSHLFGALCQKGIHTFKDNEELEAGQKISELFKALKGSRVAIVVFSENYAESRWCLDELEHMMNQKEKGKLIVMPIFYRVIPAEVRLGNKCDGQKGCYQTWMEGKHGNEEPEKVDSWKKALREAGELHGFVLPKGEDERSCVDKVTKAVMKILNRVPLEVAQCLIGIKARVEEVKPLLEIDSHPRKVKMLGIYGQPGVGKTTLSKAIFNDIAHKFHDWCFLENVRDTPLLELQRKLLRKLLREENLDVHSVSEGITMIKRRLGNKKVLVVLDDVNKKDQLDSLAGHDYWFRNGSRIIITTRNSEVLNPDVECKYKVKLLDDAEARDLFRYHAFGGKQESIHIDPPLIDQFLDYAKGLPLALVLIGSFLCGRNASDWGSYMEKIKQRPPQDIIAVLKLSFDELDEYEQEIFLDIACFFKGRNKDYVMKVLDSYVFGSTVTINVLLEQCLITIDDGKFQMHDFLEKMGKDIAHGNRISSYDDFRNILSENMGQERTLQGIQLTSMSKERESVRRISFEDFKKLKLLIIRNVLAVEESLKFASELRWLEWLKYSASAIDFGSSRNIVGIDLGDSEITQILGKDFKKLKYLNLQNCKSLVALPNLSESSDLKELNLSDCKNLSALDDSIGALDKIVHLSLQNCCNIAEVPRVLRSKDFRTINFSCCSKLRKLPIIKHELLFLEELNLEKTAVKELPDSICNLVKVKILNVNFCKELSVIPSGIFRLKALEQLFASGCPKLERFPRKIRGDLMDDRGFPDLVILNMQSCNLKDVEFLRDLTSYDTLKEVNFSENVFEHLPECICEFKNLERLWLCNCKNLLELQDLPPSVKLDIMGCRSLLRLQTFDGFIRGCSTSFTVDLSNCHKLELQNLVESLSLMEIRKLQKSAEVIVAGKDFLLWMDLEIADCYSNYTVPLPTDVSEDDILGLAVSMTFTVTRGQPGSQSVCNFSPEVNLVVGRKEMYPSSSIDQFDDTHTWFIYIPRHDEDIIWSNISLEFKARWTNIEICKMRVVCKNEKDEHLFMVEKEEPMMSYGSESESDSEYD